MNYFIIFEFLIIKYGNTDAKMVSVSQLAIRRNKTVSQRNRDATITFQVTRELCMNNLLIFDIPDLKYRKIDTKIDLVSFVLDEIRKFTEIVTSQSLARSPASDTSFPSLFSSSSTSNMVTSTQRMNL